MMKKKKTMFWGVIYVIALITVLVIVYVLPSVAGLFDRSYVAKYGNVEVKDETEGYIVRNETVYTAGKAGTVKRTVTEGELVKGNSKVVKISGEGASSSSDKYDSLLKKMKKEDAVQMFSFLRSMADSFYEITRTVFREDIEFLSIDSQTNTISFF